VLVLLSCQPTGRGGFRPAIDTCATGTDTTWYNTGRPVTLAWCAPCHSQTLVGDERQGAPEGVNLDDYAGVVAWAERIRVRATEAGDMPPMGGVPPEDLERLQEWIDCGLPGGTSEVPGFCDGAEILPGDMDASTFSCDGPVHVEGDLRVDASADLDCVCGIGGDLLVTHDASMSALLTVGGDVSVSSPEVATLSLPALTDAGRLDLVGASALSALELGELSRVGGDVTLTGLSALGEIRLSELQTVEGSVRVEDVAATLIAVDRLATVGGELRVSDSASLSEIRGTRSLSALGTDLRLESLPSLAHVDDFAELSHVSGSVILEDVGAKTLYGFHRLLHVEGDVRVESCSELVDVRGFPDLTQIDGSLIWRANASLVDWDGLNFLVDVGGDLIVEDHPLLVALPSIQRLEHVGGDFTIRDNPVLPTLSAENLAAQIDIEGTVTITGNQ